MSKKAFLMIGSAQSCPEIRYLSGFNAPDPVVFLSAGTRKVLVVSLLEKGRALEEAKGAEVLLPSELDLPAARRNSLADQALALLRRCGIEAVTVSGQMAVALVDRFRDEGIAVEVKNEPLCPQRAVKNRTELKSIRNAQRAAVQSMRHAFSMIESARIGTGGLLRIGGDLLTSERLRRGINMKLAELGFSGDGTIAAAGKQSANPHERGTGPVRAGEPVVLDIFPQCQDSGYWGDITRTVCKGSAPVPLRKMFRAVRQAQLAALKAVRAGVSGAEVHGAAVSVFKDSGFETGVGEDGIPRGFIHSTGHGVGLEIHEFPRVAPGAPVLKAGNVITVEPGLYYPETGGVRIEDTVVVTEEGFRMLASCPKTLVIL